MKRFLAPLLGLAYCRTVRGWKAVPVKENGLLRRLANTGPYVQFYSDPPPPQDVGCLIVRNSIAVNDNKLILGDCGLPSQAWRYDDGLFRTKLDDNMCMQAGRGGEPKHGMMVRVFACDKDNKLQKFDYDGKGIIKLANTNFCVVYRGVTSNVNEDNIILRDCARGIINWSVGSDEDASDCDPDCPCCSAEWPEFVAAFEGWSGTDTCYERQDPNSRIIALDICEPEFYDPAWWASYIGAYMSVSYYTRGGTPNNPVYYCGDSSSNIQYVTESEGAVCEAMIRNKVDEKGGVCTSDLFECGN